MEIKTQGKCIGCKKRYAPGPGSVHLPKCEEALEFLYSPKKVEPGYLVRISCAEEPNVYWMLVAVAKSLTLDDLDQFLRDEWLECCGHLSAFTIRGEHYLSHPDPDDPVPSMEKRIGQIFSPGLKLKHVYDMGSSTELVLQVQKTLEACSSKKVVLLMQNDPPTLLCKGCNKQAQVICSLCQEATCERCSQKHSCVQEEGDYILLPLVNSPRTGVCAYAGKP